MAQKGAGDLRGSPKNTTSSMGESERSFTVNKQIVPSYKGLTKIEITSCTETNPTSSFGFGFGTPTERLPERLLPKEFIERTRHEKPVKSEIPFKRSTSTTRSDENSP